MSSPASAQKKKLKEKKKKQGGNAMHQAFGGAVELASKSDKKRKNEEAQDEPGERTRLTELCYINMSKSSEGYIAKATIYFGSTRAVVGVPEKGNLSRIKLLMAEDVLKGMYWGAENSVCVCMFVEC
jgi:hypothetical protein